MNTATGQVYELGADLLPAATSPELTLQELKLEALKRRLTEDEQAMVRDLHRGDRIVEVSADVAHQMKLGQREVERRLKRRKAQKQARKRSR